MTSRPAPVTAAQFAAEEGLAPWRYLLGTIQADFRAGSFPAAGAFVVAVAEAAEAADHHPDIDVRYPDRVRIVLTTHAAHGLTTEDVTLARTISRIAADLGHRYAETLTGFKWLAHAGITRLAERGERFVFGFEEALFVVAAQAVEGLWEGGRVVKRGVQVTRVVRFDQGGLALQRLGAVEQLPGSLLGGLGGAQGQLVQAALCLAAQGLGAAL